MWLNSLKTLTQSQWRQLNKKTRFLCIISQCNLFSSSHSIHQADNLNLFIYLLVYKITINKQLKNLQETEKHDKKSLSDKQS